MRQIANIAGRGPMTKPTEREDAIHSSARSGNGTRSLAKGLLAGLVAGVAAMAVRSVVESFHASRSHNESETAEASAPKMEAGERSRVPARCSAPTFHWGLGAAAGAAYGAVVEYFPEATHQNGASFGLLMMALAEAGTPFDKALHPPIREEQEKSAPSYALFGVVTERVRRVVRRVLR